MATVGSFLMLVTYLVLASTLTAMVAEDLMPDSDINAISIGSFGYASLNQTNFTTATNISDLGGVILSGSFELVNGVGLVSSSLDRNTILFTQLNESNGWINTTYHLSNPLGRDHRVYLFYQNTFNYIAVSVDEDGFSFINTPVISDFYVYEDANLIVEYNLTTRFDTVNERAIVLLDGAEIFNLEAHMGIATTVFNWLNTPSYFSGVNVYNDGFQIHSITNSLVIEAESSSLSISELLGTMMIILFWNVDASVIPVWMNILFIKVPSLGLIFILIQLIRGAG